MFTYIMLQCKHHQQTSCLWLLFILAATTMFGHSIHFLHYTYLSITSIWFWFMSRLMWIIEHWGCDTELSLSNIKCSIVVYLFSFSSCYYLTILIHWMIAVWLSICLYQCRLHFHHPYQEGVSKTNFCSFKRKDGSLGAPHFCGTLHSLLSR